MAHNQTQLTGEDVGEFLEGIADPRRREDARRLDEILRRVTRTQPRLWGGGIVGYGRYHYRYASGREGDWFLAGFSPRARAFSIYVMSGFEGQEELMGRLGKFKTGKACLYVNRLEDVDLEVLEELLRRSVAHVRATYG